MTSEPLRAGHREPDASSTAGPGAQEPGTAIPWRRALAAIALGIGSILALYWNTAYSIGFTWWDSTAFSHGFLILPIVGYLIWGHRKRLCRLIPRPSPLGLAAVSLGSAVWLVGETAGVQLVQQVALVFVLQSLVLAVLGWRVTAVIAFPLFYLLFGVPFGTFLIAPLQDVTAAFVVRFLQLIGMPVHLDGIFIHIPSGSFEVAEACAGLRFLITSVALGVIFAHEFYRQLWRRALFIVLSIVVPIIANGFRATGLVLLAHYSNYELAAGADHLTYGLIFLSLVLFCLLAVGYSFREPYRDPAKDRAEAVVLAETGLAARGRPGLSLPAAAAGTVLIVAASWAYAAQIEGRAGAAPASFAPVAFEGWQAVPPAHPDWKPSFANASQEFLHGYSDGAAQVDIYVAYFTRQQQGQEVINFLNSVTGAAPWRRAGGGTGETALHGGPVAYNYERMVSGSRGRVVRYWYWVDGRLIASPYVSKLLEVKAKLIGGEQAAAVVAVAADYGDSPREANETLERFLRQAWPLDRLLTRADGR